MASDNASDKTTKGGTLMKRGEINKNWKIRWFLVKEGKLYYYKRKQDQKFIGMIPLEQSVIRVRYSLILFNTFNHISYQFFNI